jgi:hypothetical protein
MSKTFSQSQNELSADNSESDILKITRYVIFILAISVIMILLYLNKKW